MNDTDETASGLFPGTLTDLAFDKKEGEATVLSFKVMGQNGVNLSFLAASRLLPWDQFQAIAEATGEEIAFAHGKLYEIVNIPSGRVLMRSANASAREGDAMIEAVYVPHSSDGVISRDAEMATFRHLANKLSELDIISGIDSMALLGSLATNLSTSGMAAGK